MQPKGIGKAGSPHIQVGTRWTTDSKSEVVLRGLAGEDIRALSAELGIAAPVIRSWRKTFLAAGREALQGEVVGRCHRCGLAIVPGQKSVAFAWHDGCYVGGKLKPSRGQQPQKQSRDIITRTTAPVTHIVSGGLPSLGKRP